MKLNKGLKKSKVPSIALEPPAPSHSDIENGNEKLKNSPSSTGTSPFVHILESEGVLVGAYTGPENVNIYVLWDEFLAQPDIVTLRKKRLFVNVLPDFQVWLRSKGLKALEYTRYALDY